jgi:hypothetical protein
LLVFLLVIPEGDLRLPLPLLLPLFVLAVIPERVIKLLHHIVFIAHNMPIFGSVGTVQANCANSSNSGCYRPLGHGEPGASPFLRR